MSVYSIVACGVSGVGFLLSMRRAGGYINKAKKLEDTFTEGAQALRLCYTIQVAKHYALSALWLAWLAICLVIGLN